MKIEEIAAAFGMSCSQFANSIGYSRQSFYQGIRPSRKSRAAIKQLRDLSAEMFKMEQEQARRRFEARGKAIKEFEQQIVNGEKPNGHG